jgi:hypothetical protein
MCWNASVSLNTYILGLFCCLFAYFNNKISFLNVLFFQSFMLIQLLEYFIWSKQFSNSLLSKLSYILVLSQPFFGLLSSDISIKYSLVILYVFFVAALMSFNQWSSIDFRSIPASNGHLSWHWLQIPLPWLIIWFLFLITKTVSNKEWFFALFMTLAVSVSYILYNKTLTWGSLWCWISNVFSLYLIYIVFADDVCLYLKI